MGICGGCKRGLKGDTRDNKKTVSQTLFQVGERNGANPDYLPKWEAAKIALTSPRLEIKNNRVI